MKRPDRGMRGPKKHTKMNFRFSDQDIERLAQLCAKRGEPMSVVVRALIREETHR